MAASVVGRGASLAVVAGTAFLGLDLEHEALDADDAHAIELVDGRRAVRVASALGVLGGGCEPRPRSYASEARSGGSGTVCESAPGVLRGPLPICARTRSANRRRA